VRIEISAIECIFGVTWSLPEVQRWVQTVFELFGTERIMFGSHQPICGLSSTFPKPYLAYQKMTECLSPSEQDAVFRLNTADWFFSGLPLSKKNTELEMRRSKYLLAFSSANPMLQRLNPAYWSKRRQPPD
jgi:Amidohydrolase